MLLLIRLPRRIASWVDYSMQVNEVVNLAISNVSGHFASDSAYWRLMQYDMWNGRARNRTRAAWSESESAIHYATTPQRLADEADSARW